MTRTKSCGSIAHVYVVPKAHCRRCAGVSVLDSDRVCWGCRMSDFDDAGNWLEEHPIFKMRKLKITLKEAESK